MSAHILGLLTDISIDKATGAATHNPQAAAGETRIRLLR